jgi:hypothetical protein
MEAKQRPKSIIRRIYEREKAAATEPERALHAEKSNRKGAKVHANPVEIFGRRQRQSNT